jgi:hypothetical protein
MKKIKIHAADSSNKATLKIAKRYPGRKDDLEIREAVIFSRSHEEMDKSQKEEAEAIYNLLIDHCPSGTIEYLKELIDKEGFSREMYNSRKKGQRISLEKFY